MTTTLRAAVLGLAVLALTDLVACSRSSGGSASSSQDIQIQPTSIDVSPGDAAKFDALVTGSQNPVVWTVLEAAGGTIDGVGHYTAPLVEGDYHVVASLRAAPLSQAAQVHVKKRASTVVMIAPSAATLAAGQSVTFSATVNGASSTALTWSVEEAAGGTVTSAGVYTAPETAGTYHVVVTSAVDTTKSDGATVTVTGTPAPTPSPTPGVAAAFPGAQGGGSLSRGGRGGTLYKVTNLNDSGPGSLRACVEASGPRTCVFTTGGHIALHSQLDIRNPYLTIAGQTAPGGGIELSAKSGGTAYFNVDMVRIETHDVVIRFVKLRLGYIANSNYANTIVIQSGGQYNIVIDHCSIYWGMWDDIGVYATAGGYNKDITFSWNIIAEPLLQPGATGTVAVNVSGADSTVADASTDVDFHHNMFAGSDHRTPLHTIKSGRLVNNIVYNWHYYAIRTKGQKDIIGNYFKPGPMNGSPGHEIHTWTTNDGNDTSYAPSLYITGNAGPYNAYNPATDNWATLTALAANESAGEASSPLSTSFQRSSPLSTPEAGVDITVQSATTLAASGGTFLNTVGASQQLDCNGTWQASRDAVDARIVSEFSNGTGTTNVALQYETDVGGFPTLDAGSPCLDTDGDGIPDAYEDAHGLNKNDPSDGNVVQADGYTNLEHYLNGQ